MSSLVRVAIHASQFPENVRRDLRESLRARQVNHKFHYDSVRQTQKWLTLHQAYSPSPTDANCAALRSGSAQAGTKAQVQKRALRLISFLGMIPNFEPQIILPRLAALLRPKDYLLLSANLAPGADYAAGVQRILPLYDNDLTRDWLLTFLLDLGVERGDGKIRFVIEDDPAGVGL